MTLYPSKEELQQAREQLHSLSDDELQRMRGQQQWSWLNGVISDELTARKRARSRTARKQMRPRFASMTDEQLMDLDPVGLDNHEATVAANEMRTRWMRMRRSYRKMRERTRSDMRDVAKPEVLQLGQLCR